MSRAKPRILKRLHLVRLVVLTKMVAKYPEQPVEALVEVLPLALMGLALVLLNATGLLVLYR